MGDRRYHRQEMGFIAAPVSIRERGMPDVMWCSTGSFAWGAPLYPEFGVMAMAAEHYIRHMAPRGFESFSVPLDAPLPDNLGD